MADPLRKRIWANRLTKLAVFLCFGAVAAALVGAVGSGQSWWHFRTGFDVLRYAVYAAGAGVLVAIVALIAARRSRSRLLLANVAALIVAVGFLLFVGNQVRTARSVPAIHDATTNLEDPPLFYRLQIRADNLENVPVEGRPDLERLPMQERWRTLHREAYGDLTTVRVPWDVPETVRRARALAADRGWEIVSADDRGIVEAVDTSLFFRFKDDVVIRVRHAEGGGSRVDMRSISRVGVSDVGVNAKRIRRFLADLQQD
ncbi:MAG TPA: DUF1499 domain-containing protein [Allosphingosinicella sp.]|nr:DUF1499 domain-containing protein [Allosphingosinicella sp.]